MPDEQNPQAEWLQDKLLTNIEEQLGAGEHLPEDLVVFWGYAANAAKDDCARLYLNLQLNEYIEFEKSSMVFSKDLGLQDKPLSGMVVWLKRDSSIKHVRVETIDLQRSFLQGDIVGSNGTGGWGGQGGGGGGGGSMACGGGGSMACGGGGSMACGGGGSMACGGGGTFGPCQG